MLSMIKADLACLRDSAKSSLVIAALVAVVIVVSSGGSSAMTVAAAVAALTSVLALTSVNALMAYDEQNLWQAFRLTFPVTRGQVVRARYATGLICTLLGAVLSCAFLTVAMWAFDAVAGPSIPMAAPADARGGWEVLLAAALLGVASPLLACAVMLPFAFRFGLTAASRYGMVAFAMLLIGACAMTDGLVSSGTVPAGALALLADPAMMLVLAAFVLLVTLALYALSCAVSTAIYSHRDL